MMTSERFPTATGDSNAVQKKWEEGRSNELEFWAGVIGGKGAAGTFRDELLNRANPNKAFPQWLGDRVKTSSLHDALILDIGAGPISALGWVLNGVRLNIIAVDALAESYNEMLDANRIEPPVRTQQGDAECLRERFADGIFDLIHCRNALDHCYDPIRVIGNAVRLLKPDAEFVVSSNINEAEKANYSGLHQWNIEVRNEKVVIWRKEREFILNELISDIGDTSVIACSKEARWVIFTVKRLGSTE